MGWDDEPPSVSDPSQSWDAAPPSKDELGGFLSRAASNVVPDLKAVGKTLATPWPMRMMDLGKLEGNKLASGESPSDIALDAGKSVAEPVIHPVKFAEEHPVQQALNVFGAYQLGKGMIGGAPEAAASKASAPIEPGVAETPPMGEPIPAQAPPIPKAEPMAASAPPAAPNPLSNVGKILEAIPEKANDVKNYINRGYEGLAKKPGAVANVADYIQEKSQMMSAQQMGFTPLQNRQLGANPVQQMENMRAIGQYGLDSGIVSPTGGLRHMVARNAELLNKAGKTLDDLRREADTLRDPLTTPIDPLQEIRGQLDKVFARGSRAGEMTNYQRALETVEDHPPTFEGMAKAATDLNKAANSAAKINQPHGAFTDVANVISRIENERIRQLLGPEKAAQYDQALKEFGINKKIEAGLKRKVGGEVKRLGPGSLTSNVAQKALDEVGYRVGAKAANKLSSSILKNPSIASSLPSIFKEFINHVEESGQEVSGMAHGGLVSIDKDKELTHHLLTQFHPNYSRADQ